MKTVAGELVKRRPNLEEDSDIKNGEEGNVLYLPRSTYGQVADSCQ
jgi:hypothetical protein